MRGSVRGNDFRLGIFAFAGFIAFSFALTAGGCGSDNGSSNAGNDGGQFGKDGAFGTGGPCHGIGCNVDSCNGNPDATTLSGKVYAPNGTLPLYNVIVYVPNDPLGNFAEGVSCDTCGKVSGNPITSAVSGPDGTFQLKGVPNGPNIPVVFQVGKWRRQVTIPNVGKCTDNKITDPNMERLPKSHTEGDLPHIAVTTGGCDKIACVLPKLGLDAKEFGVQPDYGDKHVILYEGSGAPGWSDPPLGITPANNLWGDASELKKYDVAIFSCECDEHNETKPAPAQQNVYDYLNAGGRTFGTDFMYTWVHRGIGEVQGTGTADQQDVPADLSPLLQGFQGGAPVGTDGNYEINTTFPKGQALNQWLLNIGATAIDGKVPLTTVLSNYANVNTSLGQSWVKGLAGTADDQDRVISYTTPFSEPDESKRCGKSYYLDVHVGDAPDENTAGFPYQCGTELSPQEKMMVFFLFDLESCIQDDKGVVNPPR